MAGNRYVSASEKAKILAHGVSLCAVIMDMPTKNIVDMNHPDVRAWHDWCMAHPELEGLAREIQSDIFDRCIRLEV